MLELPDHMPVQLTLYIYFFFDQKTDANKSLGRPVTPSVDKALANLPIMIFTINFVARSKLTQIFNFQRIFI